MIVTHTWQHRTNDIYTLCGPYSCSLQHHHTIAPTQTTLISTKSQVQQPHYGIHDYRTRTRNTVLSSLAVSPAVSPAVSQPHSPTKCTVLVTRAVIAATSGTDSWRVMHPPWYHLEPPPPMAQSGAYVWHLRCSAAKAGITPINFPLQSTHLFNRSCKIPT